MPLSHTERIARSLLAHYHPELVQRHNYRPNWLRNPETGKNLEIDIFIADLQAGLEVQGVHHGRPTKGLQADFAAFEKQQRHDMLKINRCAEHGVKLYHLTIFDLTEREFLPWLQRFEIDNRLLPNRYASRPDELFSEAERLSRRKVLTARHPAIVPSVWQEAWSGFIGWLKD